MTMPSYYLGINYLKLLLSIFYVFYFGKKDMLKTFRNKNQNYNFPTYPSKIRIITNHLYPPGNFVEISMTWKMTADTVYIYISGILQNRVPERERKNQFLSSKA